MKTKNYNNTENANDQLRRIVKKSKIFMMATNLRKVPFSVCPMTLQQMDKQGDLWFITPKNSDHFRAIEDDNRVQLIASNHKRQRYISIFGNATHIIDKAKVDELWNPMLKAWFSGKDDPNLALLSININSGYYWDNDKSKMIALALSNSNLKTKSLIKQGEQGHLNLQSY